MLRWIEFEKRFIRENVRDSVGVRKLEKQGWALFWVNSNRNVASSWRKRWTESNQLEQRY